MYISSCITCELSQEAVALCMTPIFFIRIYYPTAILRVQISRGIRTPEDRLGRFPAIDQSVSLISRANSVPLRKLLSRIPCE